MSNVKPMFSFLPHFLEDVIVIFCTGRYDLCLDLFYCQQQRSNTSIILKKFPEERVGGSEIWWSKGPFLNIIFPFVEERWKRFVQYIATAAQSAIVMRGDEDRFERLVKEFFFKYYVALKRASANCSDIIACLQRVFHSQVRGKFFPFGPSHFSQYFDG